MITVSVRFYQTLSTHCSWAEHLDKDHDIEMEEATLDKSDLSESDTDTHPGSKRKAGKRSAKVYAIFVMHHSLF